MKSPFIFVVVPFKNESNYAIKFMHSLMNSYICNFSYSLLFWDDGSNDVEYDNLKRNVRPEMLTPKNVNVGYTQAVHDVVNYVKSLKKYDFVLIANSDVLFEKFTLFNLVKRALSNPNVAVVGGKVIQYDGSKIIHTGTKLNQCNLNDNFGIVDPYCNLDKDDPLTNSVERRLWVNGCASLYNLNVLNLENLNFNLDFKPAYFEEADLMSYLNLKGYSVLYEPKAVIRHKVNASHDKENRKLYENVFWANWKKYVDKWKPLFNNKSLQF